MRRIIVLSFSALYTSIKPLYSVNLIALVITFLITVSIISISAAILCCGLTCDLNWMHFLLNWVSSNTRFFSIISTTFQLVGCGVILLTWVLDQFSKFTRSSYTEVDDLCIPSMYSSRSFRFILLKFVFM